MNRKFTLFVLMAALFCQVMNAADTFTTKGDGTTYNILKLMDISEAGVEALPEEETSQAPPSFILHKNITIANGDRFEMDGSIIVYFDKDIRLTIEGEGDFRPTSTAKFALSNALEETSASLRIKSQMTTEIASCIFDGIGIEIMGEGAVNVSSCSFLKHHGSTAAALYFISAGAPATIEDCYFEDCQKAAIGSAANASQPMTINDCVFINNSVANNNIPQINITAANPITIIGGTVTGNPEHTMVGGIGISNFMGYDADITIRDCQVEDNRYGIGLVGPAAKIRIERNMLKNNCYETNPMNGGSGISLYDPYQQTEAILTGNHIEGSLWGVTVIGCKDVNLGRTDIPDTDECYNPGGNVFENNGNNGLLFDLYNNSINTVYAQGNMWNVAEQTQEQIETVIFHKADDSSLGEVIYWPAAITTSINEVNNRLENISQIYDLQGRKQTTSQKGIHIVNGKKVVR